MKLRIAEADLESAAEIDALTEILDSYARGPGGQNEAISDGARANLGQGLQEQCRATVLLAYVDDRAVGTAVCLWGFSTFAGKPTLNIHDLAVLPSFQGRGIGNALLAEVERRARERGCAKLTLEVHDTNAGAKRLYRENGFGPWDPATLFVSKLL